MKRIYLILFILIAITSMINAQNLDLKSIEKIQKNYAENKQKDIATINAVSNNQLKTLVLNREISAKTDHNFKYKVKVSGITDQKKSGRCWMFTGLNSLRPTIIKSKDLSNFEFSHNYLFFWDMLEKSNLFLNIIIDNADKKSDERIVEWAFKNPIGDGGVWNSFANLSDKYGAVPQSVMPETHHSNNTSELNFILKKKLREDATKLRKLINLDKVSKKQIEAERFNMISEVYRLLTLFLGEPPTEFSYRFVDKQSNISEYKTYTPKSFFKEMFPSYKSDDYVMLMNDPTREYGKVYEIEYDRNVLEGRNWTYINLESEKIKKFAIASIKDNEAMYASCDVGKQLNATEGTLNIHNYDYSSLLGLLFKMNKSERINSFDSGSSHAMLLMAVDTDDKDKPTKWQFENSWGSTHGHNGYLTFTDEWFDEYMFRVVVNKKFIDAETLKILDQESIILPPWDPMFSEDL